MAGRQHHTTRESDGHAYLAGASPRAAPCHMPLASCDARSSAPLCSVFSPAIEIQLQCRVPRKNKLPKEPKDSQSTFFIALFRVRTVIDRRAGGNGTTLQTCREGERGSYWGSSTNYLGEVIHSGILLPFAP